MNDNFLIKRGHFTPLAILFMILLPLVTALICICLGRMNVPVGDVIAVFRDVLTGNEGHAQNYSIVINLRLPRILMAIIVGAGLTCAGNTFQSLFSNPLATPDILGVTSGTCVGAILAIILSCGILETQLIALAFGLASVFFTLKIAGKNENRSMVYLVLAGVIASSLFAGAVFIIALGSWFAVTVASLTGISNVDKDFFEAARTLGASKRQLVFRVAIPHAMPSILQGCTQAMSSSCVALMIAEMLGVKAGLGWYMTWQTGWASYDKVFAALFVICLIFTLVTKALEAVKHHVLRWQNGVEK